MVVITLLVTVTAVLGLGIGAGYGAICGILHLMGRHSQAEEPATAVLAETVAHSGD